MGESFGYAPVPGVCIYINLCIYIYIYTSKSLEVTALRAQLWVDPADTPEFRVCVCKHIRIYIYIYILTRVLRCHTENTSVGESRGCAPVAGVCV